MVGAAFLFSTTCRVGPCLPLWGVRLSLLDDQKKERLKVPAVLPSACLTTAGRRRYDAFVLRAAMGSRDVNWHK